MQPTQPFFLYARKSTDVEDMQVLSIEAQLTELREYAARENIHIVEELVEKQSAKIPGRPIFNNMISRIEKGNASGIVSWHPDRLARNSVDGGKLIYLVDTEKITALKFPTFWFEPSPQGKFMLQIAFGQSKYYVDSLSENTKRGLRQKVRNGIFPAPAPIGYLNDVRTKTIIIDPVKAPVLKAAYQFYAKNHSRLEDVAHFLASKGVVSRGKRPYHRTIVTHILSNPFYIGLFRYGGEIHEGKHEPLMTKKLFAKVQEILKERGKTVIKTHTPKAYTGLLRCGICGMMITAETKKKFYPHTNHHASYTYYRCTKKSATLLCDNPFVREEDLDAQLSRLLSTVSLPPDWAGKMREQMKQDSLESAHSVAPIVAGKQQEISKLSMKLQRLLDSYLDQDIGKETYRKKKQDFIVKKQTLEESICTLQQSKNAWLEPMRTWISDASTAASVARGNDMIKKKELLRKAFGSNLRLTQQKARGSALEPWAALRAAPTSRNWVGDHGVGPCASFLSGKRSTAELITQTLKRTLLYQSLDRKNRTHIFDLWYILIYNPWMTSVEHSQQKMFPNKEMPPQFQIQGIEHLILEAKRKKKPDQPLVIIITGIAGSGKTTGALLTSRILSQNDALPYTIFDLPKTPHLEPRELVREGVVSADFFFVDRQSTKRKNLSLDDWWRKDDFIAAIHNICTAINSPEKIAHLHNLYTRTSGRLSYTDTPLPLSVKEYVIIEGLFAHRAIPVLKEHGIDILHIRLKEDDQTILQRFLQRVRDNPYRSLEEQYEHFYKQIKPQWEIVQKELINHPHDLSWTSLPHSNGVLIRKNYLS